MMLPPAETEQPIDECGLHRMALVVAACVSGAIVTAILAAFAHWAGLF